MRQMPVILVLLLACMQSLLVSPAAATFVLCVGSDGHLAVETAHASCNGDAVEVMEDSCCSGPPAVAAGAWSLQLTAGGCQDLSFIAGDEPLLVQRDLTHWSDLLSSASPLLAWPQRVMPEDALFLRHPDVASSDHEPAHTSLTLAIVRSVTLLI